MRAGDHPYFDPPPVALAHRGGARHPSNLGIENTLRAFRTAIDLGYRYLETDVHATSDGRLVAFHDTRLDRVTDRRGAIASMPWREVRQARIGGTEPIPLLEEVLEEFPQARVNIDIKARGAISPLAETIRAHRVEDRVCVGSFSDRRLAAFRRLAGPAVATAAGPLGTAALRYAPSAITRRLHTPAQVLQIPWRYAVGSRTISLVTPGLVAQAHRLGKQVHVWTIDDPGDMTELLDLGADGIVSDRIDVLRQVLLERGAWPGAA